MASRPDRPYSAKSRLESARPLNTSPPVSGLLARSQSQSTADATRYHSSIARAQALDDSAKTHASPSKTRSLRHNEARPESAPQRRSMSLSFTILLAVLLLLFWQILGVLILSSSLHSAQQISNQIAVQGKIEPMDVLQQYMLQQYKERLCSGPFVGMLFSTSLTMFAFSCQPNFVTAGVELAGLKTNTVSSCAGAFGAVLPPDGNWTLALQDMRLSMNVTSGGNSRKDVFALQSVNSTFTRCVCRSEHHLPM